MNSTQDYSWLETPRLPDLSNATDAASTTAPNSNSSARPHIIRRKREPNPRMTAYVSNSLAWGSPPKAAPARASATAQQQAAAAAAAATAAAQQLPPGSYCKPTPGGDGADAGARGASVGARGASVGASSAPSGMVCGVSMTYCCFGTAPISKSIPQDWPQRLFLDGADVADQNAASQFVLPPGLQAPVPSPATAPPRGGGGAAGPKASPAVNGSGGGGASGLTNGSGGHAGAGAATAGDEQPVLGHGVAPRLVVVLAVCLPVVVVISAAALVLTLTHRSPRGKRALNQWWCLKAGGSRDDSMHGTDASRRSETSSGGDEESGDAAPLAPLPQSPPPRVPSSGMQVARSLSGGAGWLAALFGAAIGAGTQGSINMDPLMGYDEQRRAPAPQLAIATSGGQLAAPGQLPSRRMTQQRLGGQAGSQGMTPFGAAASEHAPGQSQQKGSKPSVLSVDEEAGLEGSRLSLAKYNTLPAWFGGTGSRGSSGSSWLLGTDVAMSVTAPMHMQHGFAGEGAGVGVGQEAGGELGRSHEALEER